MSISPPDDLRARNWREALVAPAFKSTSSSAERFLYRVGLYLLAGLFITATAGLGCLLVRRVKTSFTEYQARTNAAMSKIRAASLPSTQPSTASTTPTDRTEKDYIEEVTEQINKCLFRGLIPGRITDENTRRRLAFQLARVSPHLLIAYIDTFQISSSTVREELAALVAEREPYMFNTHIEKFKIENPAVLYNFARIMLRDNP